ncbi:MAG: ATP synthase F1 subunit epsilon, partial [Anaerolineales bacterium]
MAIQLSITSPEGVIHRGEASAVVLPALDGEMGILPRHAPLIGQLGVGELRVKPAAGGAEGRFFVAGGFVQVLKDQVLVLATRAEAASAID